ncbi:hypothetical protein ACWA1F_01750 [Flavobacterium sp. 3-218]
MKIKNIDIAKYLGKIDLLFLSSGFEDRSKSLSQCLDKSKITKTVLFHLEDNYTLAVNNKDQMISLLDINDLIEYPKNDSFSTFNIFYKEIETLLTNITTKRKLKVILDATAFSREILLILIKVLTRPIFIKKLDICFIHTPVLDYSTDKGFWLTKGVREIRPIFGFSGIMTPSKKLLLVVFNGFEEERTEIIIESFEPNALILANPSKSGSISSQIKCLVDIKYNNIKNKFKNILVEEKEFSCLEIESTIALLNDVYDKYNEEYNIAISPLNNKTSTIGIAIASIINDAFQICYASANQYNIDKKLTPSEYFLLYNLSDFYTEKSKETNTL